MTLTLTGIAGSPLVLPVPASGVLSLAFADGLQCQPATDLVATLTDGGVGITGSVLLVTHAE